MWLLLLNLLVHHHLDSVFGPQGEQRLEYDRVARYKPESIPLRDHKGHGLRGKSADRLRSLTSFPSSSTYRSHVCTTSRR